MPWFKVGRTVKRVAFDLEEIKGKKRPMNTKWGGRMQDNDERALEALIKSYWVDAHGGAGQNWEDEVHVSIYYQRPCPKGTAIIRRGAPDTQKPDIDNVAKLFLDALNKIAWKDDSQITDLHIVKLPRFLRSKPRVSIKVTYIKNQFRRK